jgi:hypothetical protein
MPSLGRPGSLTGSSAESRIPKTLRDSFWGCDSEESPVLRVDLCFERDSIPNDTGPTGCNKYCLTGSGFRASFLAYNCGLERPQKPDPTSAPWLDPPERVPVLGGNDLLAGFFCRLPNFDKGNSSERVKKSPFSGGLRPSQFRINDFGAHRAPLEMPIRFFHIFVLSGVAIDVGAALVGARGGQTRGLPLH